MTAWALVAVALMGACAHVDRAALIASTSALACDWGQTRRSAMNRWESEDFYLREGNPILGPYPSPTYVDGYFALVAAANAMLWVAMPPRWRSIVPAAVLAPQLVTIARNAPHTGACGL
jgi:hypothetical protein